MDAHASAVDQDCTGVVSTADVTAVARDDDEDPGFGIVSCRAVM